MTLDMPRRDAFPRRGACSTGTGLYLSGTPLENHSGEPFKRGRGALLVPIAGKGL